MAIKEGIASAGQVEEKMDSTSMKEVKPSGNECTEPLSVQLQAIQHSLVDSHRRSLELLEVQFDALRNQVEELQTENCTLKDQLAGGGPCAFGAGCSSTAEVRKDSPRTQRRIRPTVPAIMPGARNQEGDDSAGPAKPPIARTAMEPPALPLDLPGQMQLEAEVEALPAGAPTDQESFNQIIPGPQPDSISSSLKVNAGSKQGSTQKTGQPSETNFVSALSEDFHNKHQLFVNAEEMKTKVRNSIMAKEAFTVEDLYKKDGWCRRVATSDLFETITLVVIAVNAVWIAIDTDYNKSDLLTRAHPVFITAENLFCVFFVAEWAIRFFALSRKRDVFKDRWLIFDFLLVILMIGEIWVVTIIVTLSGMTLKGVSNASILRLLRLLRLARMARMARLFRAVPELMIMMKGVAVATRAVLITFLMLGLLLYVFGIGFTQLLRDTEIGQSHFSSVLMSVKALIHHGVFLEDAPDISDGLGDVSEIFRLLFFAFIMMAPFTILNMLIGVMCETIRVVAETETELNLVTMTKEKLAFMIDNTGLDANDDRQISSEEFNNLLEIPEACRALKQLGVDVVGLVDLQEFIFQEKDPLDFPEFMDAVLQLRGSNTATVKDIVNLRKGFKKEILEVQTNFLMALEMKNTIEPECPEAADH